MTPRHKRMKRSTRLQAAKAWISKYAGKNIVRGYRNHFAVDWFCAVKELQMLGVTISPHYANGLKRTVEGSTKADRARRVKKQEQKFQDPVLSLGSDGNFAFIAGYTSSGFPYGITWEEWDNMEMENS